MANITLHQCVGFETADSSEVRTDTSTTYNSTVPFTGDYCAEITAGTGFTLEAFDGTGRDAGGIHCITFAFRMGSIPTNDWEEFLECYASNATGDVGLYVALDTTGGSSVLSLYGADGTADPDVIDSGNWSPSANTWYQIAVMWEPNNASGDYAVWVDDTEIFSGTGGNFQHATTGVFDIYNFNGTTGWGTIYYDDLCVWTGLETTDDYKNNIFKPRIHRYRSTKASATPDGPASPGNLDTGTWGAAHGVSSSDTTNAAYTGKTVIYGTVNTDDAGGSAGTGGPNTDTEVGDYIVCAKYLLRADRGGGGATAFWMMAHGSQTATSVTGGVSADSGKTLDISSQTTTPGSMKWSKDGTKLYVCDGAFGGGSVYQYTATTAWDLSTCSYASKSLDFSSRVTGYGTMDISSNGLYVYIGDTGTGDIFQYTLSTAWDLATASYTRTWAGTVLDAISFSEDGTEAIVITNNTAQPLYASFTTAWDISTGSTTVGATLDNNLFTGQWSDNGRYLLCPDGQTIDVYHATRAFDARSLKPAPIGVNPFDPYTDATSVGAACWGDEGKRFYVVSNTASSSGNGLMKSYTLNSTNPYSAWNTDSSFKSTSMTVSGDLDLTTTPTNYVVFSETVFPRTSEYMAIGFEKDAGGQDFLVQWNVGQVVSVENPPVLSTPRNVSCTTETITLTTNDATVTLPDFTRTVTCSTEAITVTANNATVDINIPNEVIGTTVGFKRWKGLNSQTLAFDGVNYSNGTDIANALDSNLGTYTPVTSTIKWARGFSSFVGPVDNINEKPIRIEVRAYTSNNGDVDILMGYDDETNLTINTTYVTNQALDGVGTAKSAGGWSDWFNCPAVGNYNWADPATGISEPLSWDEIKDNFIVGFKYTSGTSGGRVHAIEVKVWSGETVLTIGYFDGNLDTDDPLTDWSNISNALDGSISTWASADAVTSTLTVKGNTLAKGLATDDIYGIYVRARLKLTWTASNKTGAVLSFAPAYTGTGKTSTINIHNGSAFVQFRNNLSASYFPTNSIISQYSFFEVDNSNTAFWTAWHSLDVDDPNWIAGNTDYSTWEHLPDMWAGVGDTQDADSGGTIEVSKIEIAVVSAPPNSTRKGGRAKKDRTVSCATEVITLTTNDAIVDRGRDVNGETEVITLTENNATIDFTSPRNVTGITEEITLTENNATVTRNRIVTGTTETITITPNLADVHAFEDLTVTGITEVITVTTNNATVNKTRSVVCQTEEVTVTANPATVTRTAPRNVEGATEVILLSTTPAITNTERIVLGDTEVVTLSENAAVVTRNRVVSCSTEVVTLTTNNATVDTSRIVTGATEVITLTSNDATVTRNRTVSCSTEVITLTANAATVTALIPRDVVCSTEVITLTTNTAFINTRRIVGSTVEFIQIVNPDSTVNTERNVIGSVEQIAFSPSPSLVAKSRNVVCSTEVITLTTNNAFVNSSRIVACNTEVITLSTNNGNVVTDRGVTGDTEVITLTANAAQVFLGANRIVTCLTEEITLSTNNAQVTRQFAVSGQTEVITVTTNNATITTSDPRNVVCDTEVITLTTNAAQIFTGVNRVVTGITEEITLGANNAQIQRSRSVNADTEVISLSTQDSNIGLQRGVLGGTESIILTENGAEVNLSRNVQGSTQSLVITTNPAQVFLGTNRVVNCLTEVITLTEGTASITKTLSLTAETEEIVLSANTATVSRVRPVAGNTVAINLVTSGASINKARSVVCDTEVINLIAASANINRTTNRDVVGITEQIEITVNPATVTFPRTVTGVTEAINITANQATVLADKIVVCQTETIIVTVNAATITKKLSGVIPGYSLTYLRPEPDFLLLWREE